MENREQLRTKRRQAADSLVTINYHKRDLEMHVVLENELENLGAFNLKSSFDFSMLGVCAGAAVSLIATLATVEIVNPYIYAVFVVVSATAVLATLVFAFTARRDYRNAQKQLQAIREANKTKITVEK